MTEERHGGVQLSRHELCRPAPRWDCTNGAAVWRLPGESAQQDEGRMKSRPQPRQDRDRPAGGTVAARYRRRCRGPAARRRPVARPRLRDPRGGRAPPRRHRPCGPEQAGRPAQLAPRSISPRRWCRSAISARKRTPSATASAGRCSRWPRARSTRSRWSTSRRRCSRTCRAKPAKAAISPCAWATPWW